MQTKSFLALLLSSLAIKANASPLSLSLPAMNDTSSQLLNCNIAARSTNETCSETSSNSSISTNGRLAIQDFIPTIREGIRVLKKFDFVPEDFRYVKVEFNFGPDGQVTAISDVRLFALKDTRWYEAVFSKNWAMGQPTYFLSSATAPLDVDYMEHRGGKISVDVAYGKARTVVVRNRRGRMPFHDALVYTTTPADGHESFYVFQYIVGRAAGGYVRVNFRDGSVT